MRNIELVGPLPESLQGYVNFAAGIDPRSKNGEAAKSIIQFLTGPSAAPVYKAQGMEAR